MNFKRFSSSMHDNDPDVLEKEKQRNLKKEQGNVHDHAPGWNENLASASEAHVKADKNSASPKDMQSSTIDAIHKKHHSNDGGHGSSNAKDEVGGPLGDAKESTIHAPTGTIHTSPDGSRTVVKGSSDSETVLEQPTESDEAVKADRGEV